MIKQELSIHTYEENKQIIKKGFDTAFAALREIKESKQYKKEYGTWENFLNGEGYSRSKWLVMLQHNRVTENLNDVDSTSLPNQEQARALAPLQPEQQIEVWEKVISNGEPVTAKAIRETKIELYEAETIEAEVIPEPAPIIDIENTMSDTGNQRIEIYQEVMKMAIDYKAGTKFIKQLERLILHLIDKDYE